MQVVFRRKSNSVLNVFNSRDIDRKRWNATLKAGAVGCRIEGAGLDARVGDQCFKIVTLKRIARHGNKLINIIVDARRSACGRIEIRRGRVADRGNRCLVKDKRLT